MLPSMTDWNPKNDPIYPKYHRDFEPQSIDELELAFYDYKRNHAGARLLNIFIEPLPLFHLRMKQALQRAYHKCMDYMNPTKRYPEATCFKIVTHGIWEVIIRCRITLLHMEIIKISQSPTPSNALKLLHADIIEEQRYLFAFHRSFGINCQTMM